MFITTIRVRRARQRVLDAHITNTARLAHLRSRDCVEVMAHGETVAIAALTDVGTVGTWEWTLPDLTTEHITEATLTKLVEAAVAVMAGAKKAGLTEQPEAPEASPRSHAGKPGRSRARA